MTRQEVKHLEFELTILVQLLNKYMFPDQLDKVEKFMSGNRERVGGGGISAC